MLNYRTITLVPVSGWRNTIVFNSFIEKQRFLESHATFEYSLCMNGNAVHVLLFIPVDTNVDGGFVLNRTGLSYSECVNLINMYL